MGEDLKVFIKKDHDKIESLAVITNSSFSTNLMELQGDIDLQNVAQINRALNLKGLENLYKINNMGLYPSYVFSPGFLYPPEKFGELMEGVHRSIEENQKFLNEEQRQKIEEQARNMAEKQRDMAEKYREMAEKYKRHPIFLNYPGDTGTVFFIDGKKVDPDAIKKIEPGDIESIEVLKGDKKDGKTTIKIITR